MPVFAQTKSSTSGPQADWDAAAGTPESDCGKGGWEGEGEGRPGGPTTTSLSNSGSFLIFSQAFNSNKHSKCKSGKDHWVYCHIGLDPIYPTNTYGASPCARDQPCTGKTKAGKTDGYLSAAGRCLNSGGTNTEVITKQCVSGRLSRRFVGA